MIDPSFQNIEGNIFFGAATLEFSLENQDDVGAWLHKVAAMHERNIGKLEIIFMTDDELLEINQKYLDHDYYTDIITFPYSYDPIEGELYISLDRVRDNAQKIGEVFGRELNRVMVHGLLHLCGHDDHSDEDRAAMRLMEDEALKLL